MRFVLTLLLCTSCAFSQTYKKNGDIRRCWIEGNFAEAQARFARLSFAFRGQYELQWADFEIERGRFGAAAALIERFEVIGRGPYQTDPVHKRVARLFLSTGRFTEAQRAALEGHRWDGKNAAKLKAATATDFVTVGEVLLAKGDFATAVVILEKARASAKNVSSIDGFEWARAQIDMAVAQIGLGSPQTAAGLASDALSKAEREWGPDSVPAMDALDALGLAQIALGDLQNAEKSLASSLTRREGLYGTDHPKVAQSYLHAALLQLVRGQSAEAVRMAEHGLEIEKDLAAAPNGRWALALLTGAEVYARAGQVDEAKTCYASALPILEDVLGPDAPRVVEARRRNAELLARQ